MSHLLAFLQPDETAAQLIARTHVEPINTGIFFASCLRPGQTLEICGSSGTAKTEVLIQVVATRTLPRVWKEKQIGGAQENIVLFDLDRKFDTLRLYQVIACRLRQSHEQGQLREDEVIAAAEDCLRRFHLVQCSSSFSLLAALRTCDGLLSSLQGDGGMKLLLVDNVAAFYWLDRASRPLPSCVLDPSKDAQMSLQQAHACIVAELQALMRTHRLAVIATRHSVLSPGSSYDRADTPDPWAFREFLPKQWQDLVTMRLLLRGPIEASPNQAPGSRQRPCFAARWHMPQSEHVQHFCVSEGGLQGC